MLHVSLTPAHRNCKVESFAWFFQFESCFWALFWVTFTIFFLVSFQWTEISIHTFIIDKTGWINEISSKFQVATIFQQWQGSAWSCEWFNAWNLKLWNLSISEKLTHCEHLDLFACFSPLNLFYVLVRFRKLLSYYIIIQIFFSLQYMLACFLVLFSAFGIWKHPCIRYQVPT